MKTKVCSKCGERKHILQYSKHGKTPNGLRTYCDTCHLADKKRYYRESGEKQRRANSRQERRRFIYNFLQKRKCVDCGDTRWRVLEFDHVRGKKLFNISSATSGRSLTSIKKEIAKCDIRCANCHRLRTSKQLRFYKNDWENNQNMLFDVPTRPRKRTIYRGELRHNCKLTVKQVLAIRAEYKPWKMSRAKLARKYKVSQGSIQKILERKSWTHI